MTHRETSSHLPPPRETPLQRFGATLRAYRQQRGLSQRALTARTGIPSTYISEIEQGRRNIAVLALLRLAHALAIPAAWLLAGLAPHTPLPPSGVRAPLPHWRPQEAPPAPAPGDPERLLHLLGATIRQYRQQQGLTHKALAAKTGLDNSYIGEIERGERNVSVLNLVHIAEGLDLSVHQLLAPVDLSSHPSSPLPL